MRLDLIKLIAAAMVVALHAVGSTSGGWNVLYLLGTFGIPLFLMVNGYLLYERDFTPAYFWRKCKHHLRFLLVWVAAIGLLKLILVRKVEFVDLLAGIVLGSGRLFHLWFSAAILLILAICCGIDFCFHGSGRLNRKYVSSGSFLACVALMSLSFLLDALVLVPRGRSIREIVPAPARLITNGGYFLIGMYLRKTQRGYSPLPHALAALLGFAGTLLLSKRCGLPWASSLYPSLACVVASVAIMRLCLSLPQGDGRFWRAVRWAAPASIGIWVLHPFVLAVLRRLVAMMGIPVILPVRATLVPLAFLGCALAAKVALKTRFGRIFLQI